MPLLREILGNMCILMRNVILAIKRGLLCNFTKIFIFYIYIYTYIYEDFSKETMAIRKSLWDEVKKLKQQGKYAVIKHDKIYSSEFRKQR